ncbi:MAG: hypothetical protein K2N44_00875 [Lachnospiraceae bacterium]|nr:hypothetical protein [Lachnospiraceae bacterium]
MSEGRYNIPKQYKVDKGMPLDALFQKIDNLKCRRIFETEIESVEWSYHLVDKEGIKDMRELVREQGLSVFEVNLKRKIDPDLLTDVFSGLLQRPILMVYLCNGELSMGTYIPVGKSSRTCSTDFYPYDADRLIEVMDYDADSGKTTQQIHKRIYAMLFHQKRMIMIEKAFEQLNKDNEKESFAFEFSLENLDRIRADADFVQSQLKVV